MKAGFVILNYNTWKLTKALAEKVASFSCIDYVVVIDNVSGDDSYVRLSEMRHKKMIVRQSDKNGGYSYGNNFGAGILADLEVQIMFIANPDIDIEEGSVRKILEGFEALPDYAVLSGVEYDVNGHISQPVIWKLNQYKDDLLECFYLGRVWEKRRKAVTVDYANAIQEIPIIKGSFYGMRMKDFQNMGGLDENVFLFSEERIISEKVRRINKKIGLVTAANYHHNHSASVNKEYSKKYRQMKLLYESRLYYYETYDNPGSMKRYLLKAAISVSLFEFWLRDLVWEMRNSYCL